MLFQIQVGNLYSYLGVLGDLQVIDRVIVVHQPIHMCQSTLWSDTQAHSQAFGNQVATLIKSLEATAKMGWTYGFRRTNTRAILASCRGK